MPKVTTIRLADTVRADLEYIKVCLDLGMTAAIAVAVHDYAERLRAQQPPPAAPRARRVAGAGAAVPVTAAVQ